MSALKRFLILDVGCGTGISYVAKPKGHVNVDIEIPTRKVNNFVCTDAQHLPFINEGFL